MKSIKANKNQIFPCMSNDFLCTFYSEKLKQCTYSNTIDDRPCMGIDMDKKEKSNPISYEMGDRN